MGQRRTMEVAAQNTANQNTDGYASAPAAAGSFTGTCSPPIGSAVVRTVGPGTDGQADITGDEIFNSAKSLAEPTSSPTTYLRPRWR